MSDLTSSMVRAAIACVIGLAIGGWVIRQSRRARRVGGKPFCRQCGYSLTAFSGERCPECGADVVMPGGTVHGTATWRGEQLALGVAIMLASLGGLVFTVSPLARERDWYQLKPTRFVLNDLASPTRAVNERAWQEIVRRTGDAPLSADLREKLVGVALDQQAAAERTGVTIDLINWLGDELHADRLSPAQRERFLAQGATVRFYLRPKVIEGSPVPCRFEMDFRLPIRLPGSADWEASLEQTAMIVDGAVARPEHGPLGGGLSSALTTKLPPVGGTGRHEVTLVCRLTLRRHSVQSASGWSAPWELVHDIRVTDVVEVVPDAPENQPRFVADASLAERMRSSIRAGGFAIGDKRHFLNGSLTFTSPPADCAFDAFARVRGTEHRLGSLTLGAGKQMSFHLGTETEGSTELNAFDLVLRPSPAAAADAVDLLTPWDGVLEFKDVSLRVYRE